MIRLLTILVFWGLSSCKEQPKNTEPAIRNEILEVADTIALEQLLKCDKFDIREGHYRIPDYGCVYAPENENKLGNADVVLIPVTELFDTDGIDKKCNGNIDCLNEIYAQINALTIDEIKNNFNAIIFIVNKKHLKKNSHLDQPYNPTMPYEITPYILKERRWTIGIPYKVKDDESLSSENKWTDSYIDSLVQIFNKNSTQKSGKKNLSISQKWTGSYTAYFNYGNTGENTGWELNIDINADSIIASGDGYQMGFKDELIAEDLGNKIVLYHKKNLYGYMLGAKMNPEFVIEKTGNEYFIISDWISDVEEEPTSLGYKLNKKDYIISTDGYIKN
ncbi:MAG: hypothetical protein LBE36_01790 [Flavobacteriaceae bacterium]|nr:hypothetical protein [Flavobacteriaceae bacterium]